MSSIAEIPLTKILPNPSNPRVIKDDKFKKLVRSIEEFPEMLKARPIVVNPDMVVLGGNMRLKALQELGIKKTWVYIADWEESKNKEFIIKDNVGFGEWDWDLLANDWDEQELIDWGLDIPDFPEIKKGGDDEIPIIENPVTAHGDLWELNNHRILCGDSCNVDDVDKLINGKKADMIFTDPPYDLEDNYSQLVLDAAKNDCHVFIMNSDKNLVDTISKNRSSFRKLFYVDFKIAHLISNNQPMTRVDPIAEFNKGKGRFNNIKDGFSTLIECAKTHVKKDQFDQGKKIELPETFILHYSKPNDLICDFFLGAGSTLLASEIHNRICYGLELSTNHCDITIKRWITYMNEHNRLVDIRRNGEKINPEIFS